MEIYRKELFHSKASTTEVKKYPLAQRRFIHLTLANNFAKANNLARISHRSLRASTLCCWRHPGTNFIPFPCLCFWNFRPNAKLQ